MATPLNTIKNWFRTGLKPTQAQFWASWEAFFHKDEKIPQNAIEGLQERFDDKVDTIDNMGLSEQNYTLPEKQKLAGLTNTPPIQERYQSIAELLGGQETQMDGYLLEVVNASADPSIIFSSNETKLQATYRFNGIATGSLADYTLISVPYGRTDFTTQEITSGGNYNDLEVTADLLVFTNENAQAILNGVWGKKEFHILNRSEQYEVRINHDSSSVVDPLRRIKLPTNGGSVGVKGTARVLFTESYGYFVSDTWGSTYRPEFKDIIGTQVMVVNDEHVASTVETTDIFEFRDSQNTPMTAADLNAAYPDSLRPLQVVCNLLGVIYMKNKNSPSEWYSVQMTKLL